MPTTSETIDIDGCKLVVRRTGKGEPLLWLHGTDGLSEWPAILKRVHDTHLESVQKFVDEKKG